jgi:hypothetical protein
MRDDLLSIPQMQLKAGRLEREANVGIRYEVQRQLVRCAGTHRGNRTCEARLNRPVKVAADDALNVRMPRHDRSFGLWVCETHLIHY